MSVPSSTLQCPACGAPAERPEDPAVTAVKCGACGARYRVPAADVDATGHDPQAAPSGPSGGRDAAAEAEDQGSARRTPSRSPAPIPPGMVVPSATSSAMAGAVDDSPGGDPRGLEAEDRTDGRRQPAPLPLAILLGLLGAVVGSGVWFGVHRLAGGELAVVALAVGILVGGAVTCGGRRGWGTGAVAAACTALSLLAGRIAIEVTGSDSAAIASVVEDTIRGLGPKEWGAVAAAMILAIAMAKRGRRR